MLTWATIATNLGLGNVVVTTAGSPATAGQNGDITIAAASPDLASANKLTISAVGTLYINFGITNNSGGAFEFAGASGIQLGANVTSTGPQTYDNPVTLTADVTLTASEVTFISTVDSDSASTPRALTLDGNAQFDESVGATYPLNSLAVMGNTVFPAAASLSITVNGGTVNPEAFVYFGEAVTIGNGTSLTIAATGGTAPGAVMGWHGRGVRWPPDDRNRVNAEHYGDRRHGDDYRRHGFDGECGRIRGVRWRRDDRELGKRDLTAQGGTATVSGSTGTEASAQGYVEFDDLLAIGNPTSSTNTESSLTITANGGTATDTGGGTGGFDNPPG